MKKVSEMYLVVIDHRYCRRFFILLYDLLLIGAIVEKKLSENNSTLFFDYPKI